MGMWTQQSAVRTDISIGYLYTYLVCTLYLRIRTNGILALLNSKYCPSTSFECFKSERDLIPHVGITQGFTNAYVRVSLMYSTVTYRNSFRYVYIMVLVHYANLQGANNEAYHGIPYLLS